VNNVAEAYLFSPGKSEQRWMGDTSAYFLATGALTGGAFALVDERAKRGTSVPLHKHDDDMESFFVLEGEVSFFLGGRSAQRGGAGAFVHIPGGTIHGFRIESESARYLILTTPRHGEFYRAITSPVPLTNIDGGVIRKASEEYGIDFVGPLPD